MQGVRGTAGRTLSRGIPEGFRTPALFGVASIREGAASETLNSSDGQGSLTATDGTRPIAVDLRTDGRLVETGLHYCSPRE